ncbi:MAG: hypothetical protein K9J12_18395 [Melioribacteraceae bacterium]|nr:hypothetical protein [Melioribacteraceae bacterium]MCF8265663.1 hypothetical protein [Melioribacteraceae bacterium]
MEKIAFNELLLNTAFACMSCDGDIDEREVKLLIKLESDEHIFGVSNIEGKLNELIKSINEKGDKFFKHYFRNLSNSNLSKEQELLLIDTAIRTIEADEVVEYSEMKFFKIIRSKLKSTNKEILDKIPEIEEYLERDIISQSYIEKLTSDYFESCTLPKFNSIESIKTGV